MPRDGSNIYHIPLGTEGIPDTTIESEKYNSFVHDVERDLNTPRPIVAGGTGASTADGALNNLSAEKMLQHIDNYDSYSWMAGSFYSDILATNAPVANHAFAGIAYWASPGAIIIEARDLTDPNGPVYVRMKIGGVWTTWVLNQSSMFVLKAGDTMTGLLTLSGDPTGTLQAVPKQYADTILQTSDGAPAAARDNTLWWDTDSGLLYVRYNDLNGPPQWVIACPQPDISTLVLRSGDSMTGPLHVHEPPTFDDEAVSKKYVDDHIAAAIASIVVPPPFPTDTTLPFYQAAAPTGWVQVTTHHDKALRIVSTAGGGAGGATPFSSVFSQNATSGATLASSQMAEHKHTIPYGVFEENNPGGIWGYFVDSTALYTIDCPALTSGVAGGAGGQPHAHSVALQVQYVDLILAKKS
jgi:hypothetical protein